MTIMLAGAPMFVPTPGRASGRQSGANLNFWSYFGLKN